MAPTRSARVAAKEKENGTAEAAAVAGEAAPAKRGRGRPPKNGIAPQEKKVPSGRPRGRPPGTGGVKKATKPVKSVSTGTARTRGRPRKSDASTAVTPKKGKAAPKASSTGKRGRPRKTDDDDAAVNDDVAMEDALEDEIAEDELPVLEDD
ncbi:hypothetical protein GGR54DRAFT_256801 [Hypoxylon sp. NC1633]|nr:hypothetical protein GGR54DRAFT_256801 [Hypoxylon sp. NC1633]